MTDDEVAFLAEHPEQGLQAHHSDGSPAKITDMNVLEEHDVAFNPATQVIDLTKQEKRRTTALMLAIQAYQHLIIRDAEYLREVYRQEQAANPFHNPSKDGPLIQPATMDAMLEAACDFDDFISGRLQARLYSAHSQSANAEEPQPTNEPRRARTKKQNRMTDSAHTG